MPTLHFYDKEDRPWPNRRLDTASIVGHTTDKAVRLWLRASEPGRYWLVVSPQPIPAGAPSVDKSGPSPRAQVTENGKTLAVAGATIPLDLAFAGDLTGVVDVDQHLTLAPDTRYHYALFADFPRTKPWELGYDERLSFRTHPSAFTNLRFGFFSCHMPYDGLNLVGMEMWERLHQEMTDAGARFLIGAGDQVYVDGNDKLNIWSWLREVKSQGPSDADMVSWYRDIYRGYWGSLPVRRVLRGFPTYMIWDDHEIMDGWGSWKAKDLSNALDTIWEFENVKQNLKLAERMFEAAKKVYVEYEHSHNPPTDPGQYDYTFDYGPCAFFVLDQRGRRSYDAADGERVLGPDQMDRFRDWLRGLQAEVAFIVSPVPTVHASSMFINNLDIVALGLADDMRDEWEHESNWTERNTLLKLVFEWSNKNRRRAIFLSGDVHIGAAFKLYQRRYPDARVYQLTSSGITYAALGEIARRAMKVSITERGSLGDVSKVKPEERWQFTTLSVFHRNNFGIVRVDRNAAGDLEVALDLFGSGGDGKSVVKLNRLELK